MTTPGYSPTLSRIASVNGGLWMIPLILVAELLMMLLSPTALAQTPLPKTASGSTCDFGESSTYAAYCESVNGNRGYLGSTGYGVHGRHFSGTSASLGGGTYAVYASHINGNWGYLGSTSFGAFGEHDNNNRGYLGSEDYGAYGRHNTGNRGYLGSTYYGAFGTSANENFGYLGGSTYGALGIHNTGTAGILGSATFAVWGLHANGHYGYLGHNSHGVYGQNDTGNWGSLGGSFYGARGEHANSNRGYLGHDSYGVWGTGSPWAGYFVGNVHVTGTLSKAGGSFKIDHPLDPANQYLSHSFVESPDMKNVYDGTVTLDVAGEALVELPEYFEVLNRDFRYQLTAIGAPGPNLYVAEEIRGNRFRIAGGTPGVKVSWQVTGIRQDPWAEANRIVVEEAKPAAERGYYLHPALYGQPEERSVEWARDPEGMRAMQQMPTRIEEERRQREQERRQIEQERQRIQAEHERIEAERAQDPPLPDNHP